MSAVKDMKVRRMLMMGIGSIIILSVIIIVCSIVSLKIVSNSTKEMYDKPYKANDLMWEIRKEIISVERMLYKGIAAKVDKESEAAIESNKSSVEVISRNIQKLEEILTSDNKKKMISEIKELLSQGAAIRESISELILLNQNIKAYDMIKSTYEPVFNRIVEKILKFSENVQEDAIGFVDEADSFSSMIVIVMIGLLIIGILYACFITAKITKLITKPVNEIMKGITAFAKGDLSIEVEYQSKNEFGVLAENYRISSHFLRKVIEDLGKNISELAKGNFAVKSSCPNDYVGAFLPILTGFRSMIKQIGEIMENIRQAAGQVAAGSTQMAENAQGLAEGATEQAGAVAQLQASISDVEIHVNTNVKESKEAYEKANQVEREAGTSSSEMNHMTEAMQRINETSTQIGNIITEMEDIASQTNLLSFNAAIEAARVGEAGKGFAVVAEEIRKLAESSAQSAINTRNLIETSVKEVQNGTDIAKRTAASLEQVIRGIHMISEKVEITTRTSIQQADSIKEIGLGIEQISEVVQNNSAAADETSAASEELSAQADIVKELLDKFRFN